MAMIEAKELKKTFRTNFGFPVEALQAISFSVEANEVVGYLGPNGAGKTTTFKILTGLIKASSGSLMIDGLPSWLPKSRQSLGYLPEGPYFYEHLTARESLYFYASLFKLKKSQIKNRVEELLDRFGIQYAADRKLQTYSKGMRQRLGFAQCLIHDPSVVVLDEPMSGLDPMGRKDFRDMILELREKGKTILMSSHVLSDVQSICQRVVLLKKGQIIEDAQILDLMKKTNQGVDVHLMPSAKDFVGVVNSYGGVVQSTKPNVVARFEKEVDINQVLLQLIQNEHRIEQVQMHNENLEDYFVRVAGKAD